MSKNKLPNEVAIADLEKNNDKVMHYGVNASTNIM